MYRSRTGGSLDKKVIEFLSSTKTDRHILDYDILGSEAHIIMLFKKGILSSTSLRKLLVELERIRKNPKLLSMEGFEDVHESIEARLISDLGYEVGGVLQTARSRNDQVILDIRMMVRDFINEISKAILRFISALLAKSKENFHSIMPMYTHLQQAQLGTFSHYLLSYVDSLFRDLDRLDNIYNRINTSPLGACAIGGTSINIDRNLTASLLGFNGVMYNSIDATTSRDVLIEFLSSLSIVMLTLTRISEDFILWNTTEFGYVEVPDSYSSTSSLMPQKKNPDSLELIRAKSAVVYSSLFAVISILKGLPSGYGRDLQELKPELIRSACLALDNLGILTGLTLGLKVNTKRMREAANDSYAISADIAERLVLEKRIPFRLAHSIVGSLVKKAVSKGNVRLSILTRSEIRTVLKETNRQIDASDLYAIIRKLNPQKSVDLRISSGSPSIHEQRKLFNFAVERKKKFEEQVSGREKHLASSFAHFKSIIEKYKMRN
ncbi:MAG TPA: argininosuccinate lyase [Nitrososphaeraceae archaeon]